MPIYEYRASGPASCSFCRARFEVRQAMNEEPLNECPQCGASIGRLFSRSFISISAPLALDETFNTYTSEEADRLGLEGGFAEDQIWD